MIIQPKYDELHIREKLPSIRNWCRKGATFKEIADLLHVHHKSVYHWRKSHPEFAEAINEGYKLGLSDHGITGANEGARMKRDKYETLQIAKKLPSIKDWCKDGATFKQIAASLHVHVHSVYQWRNTHPEFAEAIREGFSIGLADRGITQANDSMRRRRDKYEILQIAQMLPSIKGWCENGATYAEIAKMLNVHVNSVNQWRKRHPEFAEAIRDGYLISSGAILNAAFKQAVGYKEQVTEVIKLKKQRYDPDAKKVLTEEDFKTITYEKTIKADARMTRFMLMNRLPEKYNVQKDLDFKDAPQVIFKGMPE